MEVLYDSHTHIWSPEAVLLHILLPNQEQIQHSDWKCLRNEVYTSFNEVFGLLSGRKRSVPLSLYVFGVKKERIVSSATGYEMHILVGTRNAISRSYRKLTSSSRAKNHNNLYILGGYCPNTGRFKICPTNFPMNS